ncbi:MAG: translocation/assembly module TamB domain-containing protein, partial [Verrucomicrobiota bacterium]|nr:translocation/assembly module TamB domain-containing protein [Verrucomicrobiota bacterium]
VNGQIKVRDATVQVDLAAVAGPVDFGSGTVQHAVVKLRASKKMPPPLPDEKDVGHKPIPPPYWTNLTSEIGLEVKAVRYGDYAVDSVNGQVRTAEKNVTLESIVAQRAANRLTLRGRYELPQDFAHAANQPGSIELTLQAPQVADFWVDGATKPVTGAVELSAQTDLGPKLGGGSFNLYATNLKAQNFTVPEVSAQGGLAKNVVYLNDLTAQLNQSDYVRAFGSFALDAPRSYTGALEAKIANLSTLEPVLRARGNDKKLAGAIAINWKGSGTISTFKNSGDLKLTLEQGRFGDLEKLEAKVDANYTPEALSVPIVFFSSDKLMIQAIMEAKGSTLEVTKIQIDQGQAKYAAGYVSVPFTWANLGTEKPLFPSDGKVLVNFQSENLDLQKLAKDLGTTAPVAGMANIKLDAQGTLANLQATFALDLTGLRSEQLKDFKPATFGLRARLEHNQLAIDGKLEQARIQPVQINASLPFDVAKIIENKKLDENTPVQASVRMPSSSINFARQFVPALERIDGTLALDVNVGGTIAKPSLSGSAVTKINAARFTSSTLPVLTNFNARLVFTNDRLDFEQFKGELAGGPFTLSGRITFPKLTEPNFDLRLHADSVLVARNDNLNVRTDADVTVTGPFKSATVAGTVGITNSKFLKNIDLIPIGVPGRPPPAPEPPATGSPELSFPQPPLRDWKFDL